MGILDKLFGSSGNSKEDKLALFVYFLTHLSLADGNVSDEETKYVSGYISRTAGAMSKQKWDRIISKSESLGDKAIKMTMKLDQHDKVELVKELIGIAASDGHFHEAELKWIMVFSVSLGLDPDIVKNEILENIEIVSNEISESTEVIDKVMKGLKSDLIKTVKDYDEVEGYTGKKIDHPELTENNIMFEKYLNNEYEDYFNFNKIIEEMVNILGSDVYQTLAKNAAFVMNDEDEIDQNLPCTEEQLRQNFLQINNIILKSSVLVSVTEKIEPSEIIDYVIFNNKSEKLVDKMENKTIDPTSFAALQVIIDYEPYNKNNGVYDIFDEGMIDKGLLNSSISIFSLFLEGSNRPTDQKLKDSIADFLDTFGYGLYLKEEFKAAVIIHNKSIELSPDNSSVAEHLTNKGKALLKLGNIEDAKKDFEKAIEKDENFEEAKKALQKTFDSSNYKDENLFNFKTINKRDHNLINVEWLPTIQPIYIDTGETHLKEDVLYTDEKNFVFLNSRSLNKANKVVETIVALNGGVSKFKKLNKAELDNMTKIDDYFGQSYKSCYEGHSFKISCVDLSISFEVRIQNNK